MNDPQTPGATAREPMRCPSCGSRLVEVERSEVLIDACPSCRGVWLDRGELDKILVQERQMLGGDPDEDFLREVEGRRGERRRPERDDEDYGYSGSHHGGGYGKHGGYRKRRKRGMLEDLLDF